MRRPGLSAGADGLTLIELLVAMVIALALVAVCQSLLVRADRMFDETRRQVDLTTSLRTLVETMTRDVASCQQVLAGAEGELVLMRAADAEVEPRLVKNQDPAAAWAFPFVAGPSTEQRLPGLRVTYRHDAVRHEIHRREEPGDLVARTGERSTAELATFAFQPAPGVAAAERLVCASVKACSFRKLGYNKDGLLASIDPPEPVRFPVTLERTAVIVLAVHVRHEEGVYAGAAGRPVPDARVMVPLWSAKRRSDAVYPEYFSSTDEDLSW